MVCMRYTSSAKVQRTAFFMCLNTTHLRTTIPADYIAPMAVK